MSTNVWRFLLSACAIFALFVAVGDAFDANRFGSIGLLYQPISEQQALITAVSEGSAAQNAGVRAGDRITADFVRRAEVLGVNRLGTLRAGDAVRFYDDRLHRTIDITAAQIPLIFAPSRIVAHVLRFVGLLLALFIFLKIPADRAARALGGFLLLYNVQGFGNSASFAFGISFATYMGMIAGESMLLMLVLFACWFPDRNPIDVRRRVAAAATIFTALMLLSGTLAVRYALSGGGPHLPDQAYQVLSNNASPVLLGLLIAAAIVVDFRTATQIDRLRLEWLTVGMALMVYSYISLTLIPSLFYTFGGGFNVVGLVVSDVCETLGTILVVYAFLRYRVLDITFAINRAAVFATISTAIVALFVLVEYLVAKYVETQSHVTSAIITVGVALIIGVSLRTIHKRVDNIADRVIFRSRHQGVEALRKFGRRASFLTDENDLLEQTARALLDYAGAQSVALYFENDDCDYVAAGHILSRYDPVVVALKDMRAPLFVDRHSTQISAEVVFPMLVRGELIGFAACAKRRMRETYTPDEIDAMNYALEHVAVQVDAIRTARLQAQIGEVQELVHAYERLGADPSRVLARIADISGANDGQYQKSGTWTIRTRVPDGPSAPRTSSTT
jgi:hypothetical protein